MGLLNLKTDLKSLKYGLDRPDLGSSREPFIKKEIPENPPGASSDFLLRQGALTRGIEDGARIGKFLTTPKGLGFITNQNLLAAQNPKIVGNPKNLYNPINTLLQTATNAVGGHLNLLGINGEDNSNRYNDIYKIKYNEEKTNKLLILKNSKIGGGSFTPPPSSPFAGDIGNLAEAVGVFGVQAFNEGFIASVPEIPIPLNKDHGVDVSNPNLLQNYTGGPGAGITGLKTNIRRTEFTIGSQGYSGTPVEDSLKKSKNKVANSKTYFNTNFPSGSISQITYGAGSSNILVISSSIEKSIDLSSQRVSEARTYFNENNPSGSIDQITYGAGSPNILATSASIKESIDISSQRIAEAKTYLNENNPSGSIDQVTYGAVADNKTITLKTAFKKGTNASRISNYDPTISYVATNYSAGSDIPGDRFDKPTTEKLNTTDSNPSEDQLFKFFLNPITPDAPGENYYLYWQAYVDTFSDQVNAEHDSYNYVGRGYPSYKYKGMTRKISLDFTIVSPNPNQTEAIYRKLNGLQALLAPYYSQAGYLRGNFFKLTFGDYLVGVPGIIDGFTLSPIFDAGFDIGRGEDSSGYQLPKAIKVSGFSFTPIADNNNDVYSYNSRFINQFTNEPI